MRGLLVAALAAAVMAAAADSPAASRRSCTPGVKQLAAATVRTFCGPARATLVVGGKRLSFAGGECAVSGNRFTVNIGSITLGGTPRYRYFGISVTGVAPGRYPNAAVAWQMPQSRGALIHATVVVGVGRQKGTFTGQALEDGATGSGTFSC